MAEESKSSPQSGDNLRWDCTKCTLVNDPDVDAESCASFTAFLRLAQHKRLIVKADIGPLVACSACENFRLWRCAVPGCGAMNEVAREDSAGDVCLNMVCQTCSAFRLVAWVCQTCSAENTTDLPKPRAPRARHVACVPRKRNGMCVRCDEHGSFYAFFELIRGGLQSTQRWDDTPRGAGVGVGSGAGSGSGSGSGPGPGSASVAGEMSAPPSRSTSFSTLPTVVSDAGRSAVVGRSSFHVVTSSDTGGRLPPSGSRSSSPTALTGAVAVAAAVVSPPFSHRRPCAHLAHELTQDRLTRRAIALTREFKEWRSVRADGNSMYRAFLIAILEFFLQAGDLQRLGGFVDLISPAVMGPEQMLVDVLLGVMARLGGGADGTTPSETVMSYFEAFPGFSDSGVAVIRKVAAAYILEHPDTELGGKPYTAHVKDHLTQYCQTVVAPMGRDGDHLTADALCKAFNVRITVVMLGSSGPADESPPRLTYVPAPSGAADSGAGTAEDLAGIPHIYLVNVSESSFDVLYPNDE